MTTYQVSILNPKADKLLQDLADLELIALSPPRPDGFLAVVERLRQQAASPPPTLAEITQEVEAVRAARHARPQA